MDLPALADYVDARMTLRPARVVVVFDGGEPWHYWARLAVYAASQCWGGAGFILVPHRNGGVAPALLQAAAAYDPDHVVLLRVTVRLMEAARPGVQPLRMNGRLVTGTERRVLVEQAGAAVIDDPAGEKARRAVAAVCSPYCRRDGGGEWVDEVAALNAGEPGGDLTPIAGLEGVPGGSRLAAPAGWGGALGVAVAGRCGALAEPVPAGPPQVSSRERLDLIRWLVSSGRSGAPPYSAVWHPAAAMSVLPLGLETAFDWGRQGLTDIYRGHGPRRPALLVAGDEAADFALALAWDRLYGRSAWLASEWQPDPDVSTSEMAALRLELGDFGFDPRHPDARVCLATTSLGTDAMTRLAAALNSPLIRGVGTEGGPPRFILEEPRFSQAGVRTLAVAGQFDHQFAVPVRRDDSGGVVMMMPSPAPAVEDRDLAGSSGLRWHVDLELLGSVMPRGRGLDGMALFAPGENTFLTNVRSGRDAISFGAGRLDFVAAGTAPLSRLARPRLREPGLAEWACLLARQSGLTSGLSPAGRRAETLRQMWGSRGDFVASVTGDLLPVLRAFRPSRARSSDAYPDGQGVVLLNGVREGYLTFTGMLQYAGHKVGPAALRDGVDALAARGVVRRGLILGCGTCGRPAFIGVAQLAQVNACPRCGTANELAQAQWRDPVEEPTWYYDLHPVARELLADHGEVPLLLSRHLRQTARRYDDVPELELRDLSGIPVAEADLLAVADDQVIVAEVKSNEALGKDIREVKRAAAKRVLLASVLRADQIILASTQPDWSASSLAEIRSAVTGHPWPAGQRPAVRLVTGLGSDQVEDLRLDLASGATAKWNQATVQ